MQQFKNIIVPGTAKKPMATDLFLPGTPSAVVVYAHGFNGFKDWGNFDLIARQFAEAGFAFVKFNFSHNGTTPGQPEEFVDLEAYGNNNYTKELDDLGTILDWINEPGNNYLTGANNTVYLLGHSMGGGIVLLKAAADARVKKVVTWASISECKTPWTNWPEDKIQNWRTTGVAHTLNSRTYQNLPLYFQLYEDFLQHESRLDIAKAIKSLKIPILLCHGTLDEAVPIEKAQDLLLWQPGARLFTVESDHVFGRKHPWRFNYLPEPMQAIVTETIRFLQQENQL